MLMALSFTTNHGQAVTETSTGTFVFILLNSQSPYKVIGKLNAGAITGRPSEDIKAALVLMHQKYKTGEALIFLDDSFKRAKVIKWL